MENYQSKLAGQASRADKLHIQLGTLPRDMRWQVFLDPAWECTHMQEHIPQKIRKSAGTNKSYKQQLKQVWGCMPIITLGKLRQEDHKTEDNLGHTATSRPP